MKKYLAKWLPVEEEIKPGSVILTNLYPYAWKVKDFTVGNMLYAVSLSGNSGMSFNRLDHKVARLFICSTEIVEGDEVVSLVYRAYEKFKIIETPHQFRGSLAGVSQLVNSGNPVSLSQYTYKVLGPVSTNAIWVKEGDEFTEDQINRAVICHDSPGNDGYCFHCCRSTGCDSEDYHYLIKGPCGHFH